MRWCHSRQGRVSLHGEHDEAHVQVRQAFTADVGAGNTLVVADYGQLELRLLAHMAQCKSMLRAFELGGDFHSRTALGMYDHIKAAIANGALQCLATLVLSC